MAAMRKVNDLIVENGKVVLENRVLCDVGENVESTVRRGYLGPVSCSKIGTSRYGWQWLSRVWTVVEGCADMLGLVFVSRTCVVVVVVVVVVAGGDVEVGVKRRRETKESK